MCCPPKKDYGTCLFCVPLALACLLVGLFLIAFGVWDIWLNVTAKAFPDFKTILAIVIGGLKVTTGVVGIVGILFRQSCLCNFLAMGFNYVLLAMVFAFVIQWVVWTLDMTGVTMDPKWKPDNGEIRWMIAYSAVNVVFFIFSWWILSILSSTTAIIKAGGSGWEGKNAQEIRALRNKQRSEV